MLMESTVLFKVSPLTSPLCWSA